MDFLEDLELILFCVNIVIMICFCVFSGLQKVESLHCGSRLESFKKMAMFDN